MPKKLDEETIAAITQELDDLFAKYGVKSVNAGLFVRHEGGFAAFISSCPACMVEDILIWSRKHKDVIHETDGAGPDYEAGLQTVH